jgi:hypothetical protein
MFYKINRKKKIKIAWLVTYCNKKEEFIQSEGNYK